MPVGRRSPEDNVISSEESRPPYVGSAVPDDGDSLFSIETGLQEASGDIFMNGFTLPSIWSEAVVKGQGIGLN
jgi:hypothetical protein